jgi:hypothetical protein
MAAVLQLITVRVAFVALLALASGCSSLVFFPMKPWVQNPANQGLAYEDIVLIHEDGLRIHGWWLPAKGDARGTVYFLHGNAQNVSTHVMSVRWLPAQGFNVFIPDYRGYGLSDGEPSLPQVLEDIQLGLDWLAASGRLKDKPLAVFGQSLGASMSTVVLAREQNQPLYQCAVLEAAFTGYSDIASDVMKRSWLLWGFRPLVVPWMPGDIDPVDHIADISRPLLLMHSKEDEIIPYHHGETLREKATQPVQFQPLLGSHIESMRDPSVQGRMLEFLYDQCGVKKINANVSSQTQADALTF